MKLAEFIAQRCHVALDRVMLLRHSGENIAALRYLGGTVEEYTAIQPTDSKYDYHRLGEPEVKVVVVVLDDQVYAVFEITGVEAEGSTFELFSPAHLAFDTQRGRVARAARKYRLDRVPTAVDGLPVTGWERRQRTPVQRCRGRFFFEIEVQSPQVRPSTEGVGRRNET